MKEIKIKKDKYKSTRGGYSRIYNLHCRKCDEIVAVYQKDGAGNLVRLYMDRIISPEKLVDLQYKNIKDVSILRCHKCKYMIAMPYIYKKEKRKAFRVFQGAIVKRLKKLNF